LLSLELALIRKKWLGDADETLFALRLA
jgi:hypothetical protein